MSTLTIESQVERVAAAFGAEMTRMKTIIRGDREIKYSGQTSSGFNVFAWRDIDQLEFCNFQVGRGYRHADGEAGVYFMPHGEWRVSRNWSRCHETICFHVLARLFFVLRHPAYSVLEQAGYYLSAHEQIEALKQFKERLTAKGLTI